MEFHRIIAWFALPLRLHVDPEGLPLICLYPKKRQRILRLLVAQKIGIEAGRFTQVVFIRPRQRGQPNRD